MKLHPETLKAMLEFASSNPPNYAATARHAEISESTFWGWISVSRKHERDRITDSPYLLVWPDGAEPDYFHRLILERCRSLYKLKLDASLRSEVMPVDQGGGVVEFVYDDKGAPIYEPDPKFENLSDEDMAVLGYAKIDRYLKGPDGMPKQRTKKTPAAAHQKIHVSRAIIPEVYGDHRHVHLDGNVTHSARVMSTRPQLAALPPPQNESGEAENEQTALAAASAENENETELGRTLKHLDELPQTPMVQNMRAHLLALVANGGKPQHPHPQGAVFVGRPEDEPATERHAPNVSRSPESRREGIGPGLSTEQRAALHGGGMRMSGDHPPTTSLNARLRRGY
jgi:hypothetical protein